MSQGTSVVWEGVADNRTTFDLADHGLPPLGANDLISLICVPNGHSETDADLPERIRDIDFSIATGTTLITWTGEALVGVYQMWAFIVSG